MKSDAKSKWAKDCQRIGWTISNILCDCKPLELNKIYEFKIKLSIPHEHAVSMYDATLIKLKSSKSTFDKKFKVIYDDPLNKGDLK